MAKCELCNDFGKAKIKYDLDSAREHSKTHFLQLKIIDDQVSAVQILQKCFPVYQKSAPALRKTMPAKGSSRRILLDYCHSIFPQKRILASPSHLTCAKCGVQYNLLVQRNLNTTAIINHACSHLNEKGLYACRHCSRQYMSTASVRSHLADVHHISYTNGQFEDKSHEFVEEISLQIKNCFGPNKEKKTDSDGKWARTASKIRRSKSHTGSELFIKRQLLCHQLIRKITDQSQSVKCRLCSSRLSVKSRGCSLTSHSTMRHVLLHFEKPTLRCRICSEAFVSRFKLNDHLRGIHSLPVGNNYDCMADEFHAEIMAMLERCYGTNDDGNANGIGETIAPKSTNGVIRKGSKLAFERKLMCHRLIRKFASTEKQLQCRLCSKWINATDAVNSCITQDLLYHALRHLKKPLFQCNQCSETFSVPTTIRNHLRKKHALPLGKNYVCSQDEYHAEILDIIRECFGDERDSGAEKD